MYQVETKVFNQAVKRNINRFPINFRFQLTEDELIDLRSQTVTSTGDELIDLSSQTEAASKHGGRRYWSIIIL